mmetsp:Transcript_27321/g.86819  ORF Transcript_27321/g.86819 Transcript_27321/m.86819 type:complete len:587 (-) Transcript_27321:397-2157(-)
MVALSLVTGCALAWIPSAVHRPDRALGRPARAALSAAPARAGFGRMIEEVDQGTDFYKDRLCEEDECELPGADEFTVVILGDLHMDPRKLDDYAEGRDHILPVLQDAQQRGVGVGLVSLGDLGESKACEPPSAELFAGTSRCHQMAADYFGSFGVPYEVVGGNHDLEGIDEFGTDEENLEAFCRIHGKPTPHFVRQIADKTLLVGLTSTIFRKARYTSHEVSIDDAQLRWFAEFVASKPADEGWRVFVFTHAPPMGSGLRVLQENHVVNGCCWLNHSGGQNADPRTTRKFIEVVREHRCIKGWFSGHFHLSHDYEDSITFPGGNNRGSCVFAQVGCMTTRSTRDGKRHSRIVRGTEEGFEICTVNHKKGGEVRLDATITYDGESHESIVLAHPHEDYDHDLWFQAYTPASEDGCYISSPEGVLNADGSWDEKTVCWWHMADGAVLGVHDGMIIEYDATTLAPLGMVVSKDELAGRQVAVIDSALNPACEGAECNVVKEQALVLYDDDSEEVTVIQPNEDGSYWRKIVRNKMIRMKEKRREQAAAIYARDRFAEREDFDVVSSWGPYTSTVGTAKTTGVPGITAKAR